MSAISPLVPAATLRKEITSLRAQLAVKEREDTTRMIIGIAFAIVLLLVTPAIWVGRSRLEAQAFNRLTGKDATTFDAMFVELRVQ